MRAIRITDFQVLDNMRVNGYFPVFRQPTREARNEEVRPARDVRGTGIHRLPKGVGHEGNHSLCVTVFLSA